MNNTFFMQKKVSKNYKIIMVNWIIQKYKRKVQVGKNDEIFL